MDRVPRLRVVVVGGGEFEVEVEDIEDIKVVVD